MTKYMITISYDGSKYCGLQKLKNEKTVQGELEKVLSICDERPVKVVSSGRTDKGVHALDQKCTFELQKDIGPYKLKGYLNRSTSKYLYTKEVVIVEDKNFHARFSVKSKTYKYLINTGPYDAIGSDYLYNYSKELNLEKMREAAKLFLGPHNYRAFVTGKQKTCDSIIDDITITKDKELIEITIKGKAFYTYMVRNIVAVLILVGSQKLKLDEVETMLTSGKKVIEYAPVPAGGLYLLQVEY